MHAYALRHAPAVVVWKTGQWLLRAARRLDGWLAARAKARDDARCLQAMSDRELLDIGIDPARIHPVTPARDWTI
jgi:uncharacterized protein YjiS (DUF1127 family)